MHWHLWVKWWSMGRGWWLIHCYSQGMAGELGTCPAKWSAVALLKADLTHQKFSGSATEGWVWGKCQRKAMSITTWTCKEGKFKSQPQTLVYSQSTKISTQGRKKLLGTATDSSPLFFLPRRRNDASLTSWRGKQHPAWASSRLLCACRCQAEQTGRKRKVFPLHHLLPTGDGEGREGGKEITGKMSAAGGEEMSRGCSLPLEEVLHPGNPPLPEGHLRGQL